MTPPTPRAELLALLQRIPARVVAARCGVRPCSVRRWANGDTRPTSKKALAGLASYRIAFAR